MDKLKERIQLLMSTKGMTNADFADRIGVQPSNISHVLSGRNKPSLDLVTKILDAFREIRTEWLINGKGAMTSDLNLFNAVGADIPAEMPREAPRKSLKAVPEIEEDEILHSSADKIEKPVIEKPEPEPLRPRKAPEPEEPELIPKKNPHKKQQKKIEKIVVFYEDNTFKEYFPEA